MDAEVSGGRAGRAQVAKRAPACGAVLCLLVMAIAIVLPAAASASGNASSAAGFIEGAQNKDGGFPEKHGQASQAPASLWAAAALLAAGKNPVDEYLKNGASLDEYLADHESSYTSLSELGLLAMVHAAAEGSSAYGNPAAKLEGRLTASAARQEPGGAALAVLGLMAVDTSASRQIALAAAQTLLASPTPDGGWGNEGLSDSASTALVLQALAATGVANASSPAVKAGVDYLHKAQGNDGSIAASTRTDQAIASGSVTATAFTIQALAALGLPTLRTPTGKSVLEGLTQYQQQSSGGLTSDGSLYSEIPPSVTETSQAFPAFNGITFPLAPVRHLTSGPPGKNSTSAKSGHVSAGSAAQGVSGAATTGAGPGAYKQAVATGTSAASTAAKAGGAKKAAAKHAAATDATGGTSVNGEVVGAAKPANLVSVAGQSAGGLTAAEKATLALAALLVGCALLGGVVDARRPSEDERSFMAAGVAGGAAFLSDARARGAFVPFAVLIVGAGMIAFPFATGLNHRAPSGAKMITAFKPYMQSARLTAYEADVRELNQGFTQAATLGPSVLSPKASKAVALSHFSATDPQLVQFEQQWPAVDATFTGLLATMQANRSNYDAVAALPRFTLFPLFFIVPGAILLVLAAIALSVPQAWRYVRWGVAALGVGLMLAPLAFGMWSRAPSGQQMITAFRTVESRPVVTKIQNDFGTITTGEGALGGELIPALEARGLSTAQIETALPAVTALEGQWIGILQNLTPMIGVMSDNVGNYQAVVALPPFGVFPWLFVLPGVVLLALVVLGATSGRVPLPRRQSAVEPQAA